VTLKLIMRRDKVKQRFKDRSRCKSWGITR